MLADFTTGLKQCSNSECGLKPISEFAKNKAMKDGLTHYCKTCSRRIQQRSTYQRDPAKRAAYMKTYMRKRKYDLSENDIDQMLATQKYECAICKVRVEDFHIDHNHVNGSVRGLLCQKCNMGLGLFNDSPDVLTNALQYLVNHLLDIRNLNISEEN